MVYHQWVDRIRRRKKGGLWSVSEAVPEWMGKETGMEVEFDVTITAGVLYDYMLRHTYSGFAGILGTAVGALFLIGFTCYGHLIYLIAGVVLLIYQPASLFLKSRQQAAANPAFHQPLHYKMTEEGVEVSQGEASEFQKWEDMHRAISTGQSIILYTNRIHAAIFPRRDLGNQLDAVVAMISTHMPPRKVNVKL